MNRLIGGAAQSRNFDECVFVARGKNWLAKSWLVLLCVAAGSAPAQEVEEPHPQTQLMSVIEPKYEQDPTSVSPLGDDFNPATGTITFSATDISIPGNFAIPVELRRWVPSDDSDTGGPAGWKWNIPFIRGNYLDVKDGHSSTGWNWGDPAIIWRNGKNCTGSADTVIDNGGRLIAANAYWQGKLLHIPGVTSETFLTTSSGEQVTKSHFKIIECIDNPSDAQGIVQQGIVVQGPDGTRYTFNQIKSYYNNKTTLKDPIVRTRLLMITTIKDRFNNEVNYHYDVDGKLATISSSDGREITITYQNGQVHQAIAHGRTWTYGAGTVTLPDGRYWNYVGLSSLAFKPNGIGGYNQQVRLDVIPKIVPGCTVAAGDYLVNITSPDGLLTKYRFRDTIHYRSDVEPDLYSDLQVKDYTLSRALYCTVKRSLVSKVSSGPGVGPYTWYYTYSGNGGTYTEASIPRSELVGPFDLPVPTGGYPAPILAGGGAEHYRSVTVRGPDKRTVFYIDRRFQSISEERVVARDILDASGATLLERSESSFGLGAEVGMHWYMCPCEGMYPPINEKQLTRHINQTQERRIRYVANIADATFTTAYSDFDARGRAKTVNRSGSAAPLSRTERVLYELDNATLGVMGQVKSISVDGISEPMVEHTYDGLTAQRTSTMKFRVLQARYEYHTDGNLWKHIDGRGYATTYTDYRRGQPQRIERANNTFETADVNDWGLVSGRIDPNGYSWSYRYDQALRLEEITPPAGWTHTSIAYDNATVSDFGVAGGHMRQTVDKGNARTVTYFDALSRPLMVRSYDISNEANTRKVVVKKFNVNGQLVSESYPQRDVATVEVSPPGRRMQYDALGRNVRLEADSSTGVRVTTTTYLSGFRTRVTRPGSKITTQSLWALDDPDNAQLAAITAPEGVNVAITRNILGNPISVRRWGIANGVDADVTRRYVYEPGQRVCKTLEPEVIATVQGYDLAGNVAWRSPGVSLSGNSCESEASVPLTKKISYTYDAVNQLKTVAYGDGSPGIARTYWNDGLLKTITSNGSVWSYEYNSLRLPTLEELNYEGKQYLFVKNYDTNGNLSQLTYPTGGPNPAYRPNALGEPSQVGTYATNIAFHPNGAVSGFTFGNNIVHSQTQTVEGAPQVNTDGTILNDSYAYDANGNVIAINDLRTSPGDGSSTRVMKYDNLDRLVEASGVWGSANYIYDPVDNLREANVGIRRSKMTYGSTTKRLDSVVTNGVTTVYNYDGNGNIRAKGGQIYEFDLGNRLAGTYAYDGHGRRTKITNSDGSNQIQVYSQGGQLLWSEKDSVGTVPATVSYVCSTGTLVGVQCVTTSTYPATSMTCNAGDTLNNSTCTHTSAYAASASYSCPSGGSLSGSTCTLTSSYTASVTYSCNGTDALSGSTCTRIIYSPATVTFECPTDYTLRLTSCTKDTYVAATVTYNCNGAGTVNADGFCVRGILVFTYDDALNECRSISDTYGLSLETVTHVSGKSYNCVLQPNTTYSCPDGGVLNGMQCVTQSYQAATKIYKCSAGTLVGIQCAVPETYTATSSYSCPNGGSPSGSTCVKTSVYTATADYDCPNGGTLSGSSCMTTSTYPATSSNKCNDGDTLDGSTCTHSSAIAATVTYNCPNGGTPTDGQCVGANSIKTAYIYLGGKQIAETVVGGATQYVHADALGSPVAHTDQAGAELNRTKYEPYGFTAAGTKPGVAVAGLTTTGSAIGFTGHVNDPETDLVYMQQRYYDPVTGRFLSIDPVVTDANSGSSFNRYAYANNNPYKYIDPDGRVAISAELCVGKCLGITIGYSFKSGELAVTGNYGSGIGGGVSGDLRLGENGRANAGDTSQGHGAVVNSYAKGGFEVSSGPAALSAGGKAVAGMDLSTGKAFTGAAEEYGVSKSEGLGKVGIKLVAAVGIEAAAYVNVKDAAKSVVSGVQNFVETANKEFTIGKITKPAEGY